MKCIKYKYPLLVFAAVGAFLLLFKRDLLFTLQSHDSFQQINAYRELQGVFNTCDESCLVTFDVDDTLITAADVMANFEFPIWFKIRAAFRYPEILFNKNKQEHAWSLMFQQAKRFVFDTEIVNIIEQIQRQGVSVVALTSMENGPYGCIKSMPEWRASMLRNFGINFSKKFKNVEFTTFPLYRGQYPCLYNGIICTNQQEKGKILAAFLDHYHLKPTKIISFDDQASALCSIANTCIKKGIDFSGYQILGAKKLYGQWNTDRALVQLDFLMLHSRWLNDNQASAILN